ncbi:hypothetical protein [Delftia phage PhiW-14]|uniref:Uncharacterized protein n=1 Tax=Delftia phage PhiW-14 TaxID=665032 RepID=C9DG35_BPW14|nr:head closure Hc2 [Delftia phage PhiW-14]ACV50086.1 hypothetical protein [Delftia phage PhiW-14]
MRTDTDFVSAQLPRRMLTDSPRVIALLDQYYDWQYRNGLTRGEVRFYREKESEGRYDPLTNSDLVNKHENWVQPGIWHQNFHDNMTLYRAFDGFETADAETFTESDGLIWDTVTDINAGIEMWSKRMNHTPSNNLSTLEQIDEVRYLRLLKHLYASKGTNFVLRLLFNIFFGEDIQFFNPKLVLARIDDDMVIDGDTTLIRDDEVYQEYSMVIKVTRDPIHYQEILDRIYYPNFHPGGFKLTLIKE